MNNYSDKKNKIIIAIDGYSSLGKSTLAKDLAKKLNYKYIDSGAMYRAITLLALRKNIFNKNICDYNKLLKLLSNIDLRSSFNKNMTKQILFDGENIESEIRSMNISDKVSIIASIPIVRKKLLYIQQNMGIDKGIVMDGRDIGSIVFPNASLKIFLTASLNVRVKRRYQELIHKKQQITYNKVLKNILERDYIDKSRFLSPLIKPIDAIEIDNTNLSTKAQLDNVYYLAINKIKIL